MNFDRIADRYDATRGGAERGRHVAAALSPRLPGARLLEIGVGTGLIAAGLAGQGRQVLGVDLSSEMLEHARLRVPGRLARADAARLPLRPASIDGALAVHVLHLVGDPGAVLAELARVLRPGGRLAVVGGGELAQPSDVGAVLGDLRAALRSFQLRQDRSDAVQALAAERGLRLAETFTFPREDRGILSPREAADQVESRVWSHLWDLDDAEWARAVAPALDQLRALPDQDRARPGSRSSTARIFERD
ncbi:class I SAM-dependent methyltransferase [Frankia sp. AiPa1]|uniref:class I SAM-dependent methyltransferase n=1 Tax=Frankia sp. AiPa1 TaxID=573492 RepID=UPI00202B2A7E|nr:class I SAM-dependent methyltransferase [Frankia sp. AiPa1]MCL9759689.1 class I SAM-dependent methyltransferase [Frankia sp. AiPa1]